MKLMHLCLMLILSLLVACMPPAPHMWIGDEFQAVRKYCAQGLEGKSKSSHVNIYLNWQCPIPVENTNWERDFLSWLIERGWYSIDTAYPWNSFCHKEIKKVSLRYSMANQPVTENKKYASISLHSPAKECEN